ncbi:MAG: Spore germination protein GerKA [Oscillospiraceae bacterium]|nr:Spore germination protein GerKA [Oscillospiraceae bacterium]
MGLFGGKKDTVSPHPRKEPRIDLPLTVGNLKTVFWDCVDFATRTVMINNDPDQELILCYVVGMTRMERACDYVLRPLCQNEALNRAKDMDEVFALMMNGALYDLAVTEQDTMDKAVTALINGDCLLLLPNGKALSFSTGTEEKRSVSTPEDEPSIKGAKDSFVEGVRTNTSLVRRRLRAPELRVNEQIVGRQSLTPVDILYIKGIANPTLVEEVSRRLKKIDIDAALLPGNLEEYIVDEVNTAFPLVLSTQRPDRFCAGLTEGRVGLLVDGIPQGYLLPGTIQQFFKTAQDKSENWVVATSLLVLRYLCMLVTLFLPALYIAAVTFHPEIIPTKLALSIIKAKADVPFATVFEVLIMLVSFEILQEAGLRLPTSLGQTVSILGGLVVGTAAVQAKIVSPAVLIVVAVAGIAGYTAPSQDFAGALRIWRLLIAVAASVCGLFGMIMASAVLIYRLSMLESFGVAYLTPFTANDGEEEEGGTIIRQPLPGAKLREKALNTLNRRNQK